MSNFASKGSIEQVPIAGDNQNARDRIIKLSNQIGMQGVDAGDLKNAYKLERSNKLTFNEWKLPTLICVCFVLLNFVWTFFWYYLFPKKPKVFAKFLQDFSVLSHLNKVFGFSALQLLAFVYLPSVIAGVFQLKNGTKYKHFPCCIDFWLRTRKQFGLWAFLIASCHVFMTIFVTNPSYVSEWYRQIDNANAANEFGLTKMTVHGEINVLSGILAYVVMFLVALSSINSIANSLNWSEWRFVQSKLGMCCLLAAFLHDFSMYLRIFLAHRERGYSAVYLITRVKLIGLYFPLMVLVFRFVFAYFCPISRRIARIRAGITV